jgi:hypothetical protein
MDIRGHMESPIKTYLNAKDVATRNYADNGVTRLSIMPRGYVYDKYYNCMTNHTLKSCQKGISPTRGKASI